MGGTLMFSLNQLLTSQHLANLGEAQLKKSPCNICRCLDELNLVEWTIVIMKVVSGRQLWVVRA